MSAHRWTLRGDAPTTHGPSCTTPNCCWTRLTHIPGGGTGDTGPDDPGGVLSVWAGWCTYCGDTDVTDTGACVRCTGGDAA